MTTTSPMGSRRWLALGAVNLAVLAVGLDGTVLSVALPTLAVALKATESDLQWFSSGYLLVLAAATLPIGLLGDRYGRQRVMVGSLGLFALGSAACALSPSPGAFIAARLLLGLAGAGVIVMSLSALTVLFSEEERPKAVGVWSAANFLALPVGPILGGWLLSNFWWGWVFLINVPVTLVGLLATLWLVPESRAEHRPDLDPVGVLASVAGLVGITYGLIDAGVYGWVTAQALLPLAAGVLVVVGFFAWEGRLRGRPGPRPMLDLSLFRSASFTWAAILMAVLVVAMIGVLFTMPQFFQGVWGTDPMGSGLRLLPLIAGLVLTSVSAAWLAGRVGAKLTVAAGFGLLAAALLVGSRTDASSGSAFVAAWMFVVGMGMGLALATAGSAALSELPKESSGVGAGVIQALNKTGGPLGTAVLGSVVSAVYLSRLHLGGLPRQAAAVVRESIFGGISVAHQLGSDALLRSVRHSFVAGLDMALLVSAGVAVAGMLLALAFLPRRRVPSPEGSELPAQPDLEAVGVH